MGTIWDVKDKALGKTLWHSFEHLGDTMLPLSTVTYNHTTGENHVLTSWKNYTDTSPGDFVFQITPQVPLQACSMRGSMPYWRSGPWAKTRFTGIPLMDDTYTSPYILQQDATGSFTYFERNFKLLHRILTSEGVMKMVRHNGTGWELISMARPVNSCNIYGACAPFGFCIMSVPPKCKCFKGFVPKFIEEWKRGNWTGGCVRHTELDWLGNATGEDANVFHPVPNTKPPDFYELESSVNAEECYQSCLHNFLAWPLLIPME